MLTYQSFASGKISVADSSGNVLAEYTPSKNYSCVVVSCPGLTKGGTYTVTACGQSQSVTLDGIIYGSGSMGGTARTRRTAARRHTALRRPALG